MSRFFTPTTNARLAMVLLYGGAALGVVAGLAFLLDHRPGAGKAEPMDANVAVQIADAARSVVPQGRVARQYRPDGDGWQVSLVDPDGRCWKVQVQVAAGPVAAPVGRPTLIGCWAMPNPGDGVPSGDGDHPDEARDATARGFLDAYLTGGDLSRFAKPGVEFPQPTPPKGFQLLDSHEDGSVVTVNGWVTAPTADDEDRRVDVTWRLTLDRVDVGWVVTLLDAGPPSEHPKAPATTVPPTTSTTHPTTTTTTMPTSTTKKGP